MSEHRATGHCLCRSVTFEYDAEPNWVLYCHCESCRRATSSPATVWISVPRTALRFTSGEPRYFSSSPGVRRGFCSACGSPLTYENEHIPDEVHLYAVSLADELPRYAVTRRGGASPMRHGPRINRR
jgi:hypothetical protein